MATEIAPVAALEHQAGDVIAGRYRLKRKLGEGAMGVVWVAHSMTLDVDVALKMLHREMEGTGAVERMTREARATAQLGHPALVRMFDFGTSEAGSPFLAMELLEGEVLRARLVRETRLPALAAVALMLPVIDGLGTAHAKSIIHRDLKPENIFIATDQRGRVQPKVLDFGVAQFDQQASTRLTQAGAVVGSPFYLSPEQAKGLDDLDVRTDVWAIGVVIYELVTGVPPFVADNYNALLQGIRCEAPLPISEYGAGDEQLWMIIERCLKKDREERWASMWELGEALALWLFERGVRVDAAARSLRHGWLESGLTGLQIIVPSDRPDAPASSSEFRVERTGIRRVRPPELARCERNTPPAPLPAVVARRSPFLVMGLVVALVAVGAGAFLMVHGLQSPSRRVAPSLAAAVSPPQQAPDTTRSAAVPFHDEAPAGEAPPAQALPSEGAAKAAGTAPPLSSARRVRPQLHGRAVPANARDKTSDFGF